MSLDLYIESRGEIEQACACSTCGNEHGFKRRQDYFSSNITHNLSKMFDEAGVDDILWHGDGRVAGSVVDRLREAERIMLDDPPRFQKHNPENGWGDYEGALRFLRAVIEACVANPEGVIRCSR